MAEIVNLRRVRKSKLRGEEDKQAAANRSHFGTAKRLRDQSRAQQEKAAIEIEGHRLETDDERRGKPVA